jgi:hypothetical protein
MGTVLRIVPVVVLCCVCSMRSHAEETGEANSPSNSKERDVTIEIAKLEVADSSLGLTYTIRNRSDHDVWICSNIGSNSLFEVFLTSDGKTLLIRKRMDVPSKVIWHRDPPPGTYVCLNSGADQTESLRMDLPIVPQFLYAAQDAPVNCTVRRLALEVGFYDEDLPALIRDIAEIANTFSNGTWSLDSQVMRTYFRGMAARYALMYYTNKSSDAYGEGGRVYIHYSYQALTGEKVLRAEINGVSVPYVGPIEKKIGGSYPVVLTE